MKSKTNKTSLIVSLVLFVFFGASFFFLYKNIENNIKLSEQSQMDFDKEKARREEIKDFNNSFKSIEKEKALLETHFAQSSNIVPFLDTIEKMAKSVNTEAEVSFIEIAKDNTGLILVMKDAGSFLQVYKFITLLENSPYELEFISVEMHSVKMGSLTKDKTEKKGWEALLKIKLISFL